MKKYLIFITLLISLSILTQSIQPALAVVAPKNKLQIEAQNVFNSRKDINVLLKMLNVKRDSKAENSASKDYVSYLVKGITGLSDYGRSMVFFVAYGTPTTRALGIRERSGVLDTYKTAFNRLPMSEADWYDIILISNGTAPKARSVQAEQKFKKEFRKAFGREPVYKGDETAILIMAYGIRPIKKDPVKENSALTKFKSKYGYTPTLNHQWNILRAIAYSGVK